MVMARNLLLSLMLCSALGFSQELRLTATTTTDTFPLGSWIDVHVDGKTDAVIDSIAPLVKDSIGSFETVKVERKGTDLHWLIRLTTIDSGKVFLPPVEFNYKIHGDTVYHKAFTNSLLLTVTGFPVDPQGKKRY